MVYSSDMSYHAHKDEMMEIDSLIHYAIKEGYIDDSAEEWTVEEKRAYFERCEAYEPEEQTKNINTLS